MGEMLRAAGEAFSLRTWSREALLCSLGALLAFGLQRLAWETRSIACRNVSKQWGKGHGEESMKKKK